MVVLNNGWVLRRRQEECHDKLIWAYNKGYRDFFIAAVCRFGKTITTIASLRDLGTQIDPNNQIILILSTMDIKAEWFDGAEKVGFDTSLIGESKDNLRDINTIDFSNLSESGKHIIYVSTQKLGNSSIVSEALIKWFNRHEGLKSIVYDECHLGSGTLRTAGGDIIEREYDEDGNIISKEQKHILGIIERLDYDNRVYLSGTPYRKYLQKEFQLDRASGDDISYKYTLTDEKLDYKNGIITDYIPVQLQMHILDYSEQMQQTVNAEDQIKEQYHSISSAYFKKIFNKEELADRAREFLNKIIEFSKNHSIKNWLFFVPSIQVAKDIVSNYGKEYRDQITFLNISDNSKNILEEEAAYERNVKGLNQLFDEEDGKLKIGITCQKCGTGSTMKKLDAVAFLKDTTNAIQFIQKSQRPRTPLDGKSVGYVLCFNTFEGLQAFKDYAVAESKSLADKPKEEDACKEFFDNNVVELYLGLKQVTNYEDLINIDETYIPGRYPLFNDFDFTEWPDNTFVFLTSLDAYKRDILSRLNPKLRNDPNLQQALESADIEALANALEKLGKEKDANDLREAAEMTLTEDQCRAMLEAHFVDMIRSEFYEVGRTREDVLNVNGYDDIIKMDIEEFFGLEEVWKSIIETYPRYVNMIYNYLESGFAC